MNTRKVDECPCFTLQNNLMFFLLILVSQFLKVCAINYDQSAPNNPTQLLNNHSWTTYKILLLQLLRLSFDPKLFSIINLEELLTLISKN